MSKSIFKNYISLIFALWLSLNYCYLQFSSSEYDPMDLMSSSSFLLYIAFSYSLTTIGYFLWLIWHNGCGKTSSKTKFKVILSVSIIMLIIGATCWMYSVYEVYEEFFWRKWYEGMCLDSAGNNITITVITNPALHFRWILFCSYIPCIIIAVLFYLISSSKTKNSHPIINKIVFLLIFGLSSNPAMVIFGIPFVCLPVMLKNGVVQCNRALRIIIYLFVLSLMLITIVFLGPFAEALSLTGGPVSAFGLFFLLLVLINVWFYIAVFVGFIFIGISKQTKFILKNPFSRGFKIGVICFPILLFVLCYVASIFKG